QAWAAQQRSTDRLSEPVDRLARHDHVEPADLGFVLLRLAVRDLGSPGMLRRDMLVRYRRVPDPVFPAGRDLRFVVPADAFAHTNPAAVVRLHATLASDKPLPHWLAFDGVAGVLRGQPPKDFRGVLQIHITARDNQGLQASTKFNMAFGDPYSVEMPPETITQTQIQAPAASFHPGTGKLHLADLGVDVAVAAGLRTTALRRPKEEGLPRDRGAAGFADQLRRAQARGGARTDDNLLWALRGERAEGPWGA
ncbi:MAG TPA: putative Ig domain-containing protein, partial [Ramlibacter sp.]|nr:putative Ig domain-containing protein [Ramlibacter sp.]